MDRIKNILQTLSKTEKRYVKSYLEAFHGKGDNKALQLIKLIENNPAITQEALATKLYGKPKTKAILMLKSRLLDRILDVLTLSINLDGNAAFKEDPPALEQIHLFKAYTHAMLMRRRGLDNIAEELLQKALKQAETLSLPEGKLLSMIYLRNLSTSAQDVRWTYKKALNTAIQQYENDIIGVGFSDEFRVLHSEKSSGDPEKIAFLREATSELELRLQKEYSVRTHYYYLSMMVATHELTHNLEAGREGLRELLDLVNTQPGLDAPSRKGVPYLRLAGLELRMGQFEAGYEAGALALSILNPHRNNYLSASVYYLFACIYTDRLDKAFETFTALEETISRKQLTQSGTIIKYLESCTFFIKNDFAAANQCLFDIESLLADKQGWNVGMRIYEILITLEMGHYDLAASRIENLRKHLGRHEVNERESRIFRFLYLLDKHSYDFAAPHPEMQQILEDLSAKVEWSAISHEVIRFDTWARSKMTHQPFYPLLLEELEEMG